MSSEFDFDASSIKKLAEILVETNLTEIEYQLGEKKIRVTRSAAIVAAPTQTAPVYVQQSQPTQAQQESVPAQNSNEEIVRSPMVGTAYLSPEPGAPAFVKVGDQVQEGQKLMIIEAMKVMNPIKAPFSGIIKKIIVNDSKPVEYNEPLFAMEKA